MMIGVGLMARKLKGLGRRSGSVGVKRKLAKVLEPKRDMKSRPTYLIELVYDEAMKNLLVQVGFDMR
jgi:hypothetical protein